MHLDVDLSLPGVARLVAEFLDRLDLRDVTLVGNDTGGALVQLLMGDGVARVGRAVLVSCDAFDNFPPGLTGRTLVLAGRLSPRMFGLFMQQMRLKTIRRLPIAFGWLTRRGDAATLRWSRPVMRQADIRRDTVRVLRAAAADTEILSKAAERLTTFERPALVVWASEDRVMRPEHGRRLAELLPQGRLVEVEDSYTPPGSAGPTRPARPGVHAHIGHGGTAPVGVTVGQFFVWSSPGGVGTRFAVWAVIDASVQPVAPLAAAVRIHERERDQGHRAVEAGRGSGTPAST
ncbi:alpha/beta fold hydrolase, partial [Streptomyces sp. NPDC001002]